MSPAKPYLLNLGCGARTHPDWINIDLTATAPGVIAHNARNGIPFPDQSCAAVYHSHMLEHIPRGEAVKFLRECLRVLVPGGVIRVAVPDLEEISRIYLEKLEQSVSGNPAARADYEWIMLEMYDQTVRNRPGGGMAEYLKNARLLNKEFVLRRIGEEGKNLIGALQGEPSDEVVPARRPLTTRIRNIPRRVRGLYQSIVTRVLLGSDAARKLAAGNMRLSGEVHQWMYDRFSLAEILKNSGFSDPKRVTAISSDIPGWNSFQLDTDAGGNVRKPDSLFMEARRPAGN